MDIADVGKTLTMMSGEDRVGIVGDADEGAGPLLLLSDDLTKHGGELLPLRALGGGKEGKLREEEGKEQPKEQSVHLFRSLEVRRYAWIE